MGKKNPSLVKVELRLFEGRLRGVVLYISLAIRLMVFDQIIKKKSGNLHHWTKISVVVFQSFGICKQDDFRKRQLSTLFKITISTHPYSSQCPPHSYRTLLLYSPDSLFFQKKTGFFSPVYNTAPCFFPPFIILHHQNWTLN